MPMTKAGAHSAKCASSRAVCPSPAGTSYLKAPTAAPLIGGDKVTVAGAGKRRIKPAGAVAPTAGPTRFRVFTDPAGHPFCLGH
jgi:hypothetical protein